MYYIKNNNKQITDQLVVRLGTLFRKSGYKILTSELSIKMGLIFFTIKKYFKIIFSENEFNIANRVFLVLYILNRIYFDMLVIKIINISKVPITCTTSLESIKNFGVANNFCLLRQKWDKLYNVVKIRLNDISFDDNLNFEKLFITKVKKAIVVNTIN